MSVSEMISYSVAQLIGAIVGGFCGGIVAASHAYVRIGAEDVTISQALLAEVSATFILCFVILCVATNSKVDDNQYYALAIGLVVTSGAIAVGPTVAVHLIRQ